LSETHITVEKAVYESGTQVLCRESGIARKGMGTVRGRDASFGFAMGLEPQFSHDAFHSFMIDGPSLPLQLLGDAPLAIVWPFASHGCNGLSHLLFI